MTKKHPFNTNVFSFHVAGVTREYEGKSIQEMLSKYAAPGMTIYLIPEPENQYDHDAVAVFIKIEDEPFRIGYVPKTDIELKKAVKWTANNDDWLLESRINHIIGGAEEKKSLGVIVISELVNVNGDDDEDEDYDDYDQEDEKEDEDYHEQFMRSWDQPAAAIPQPSPVAPPRPPIYTTAQSARLQPSNTPKPRRSSKDWETTLLFCTFLGFFGAHYFYLGRIGKGFLYLFTGGLACFGWWIDVFVILFNKMKDKSGAPIIRG